MDTLVKADIFFFITSVSVVILTLVSIVVGYHLVKALKEVKRLSEVLEDNVEETGDEVQDLVQDFKQSLVYKFLIRRKKKRTN